MVALQSHKPRLKKAQAAQSAKPGERKCVKRGVHIIVIAKEMVVRIKIFIVSKFASNIFIDFED